MNAQQARRLPITQLLAGFGFQPQRQSAAEAWYRSPLRPGDDTPSFKVNKIKNLWYDHGMGEGGNALDLACRLYKTDDFPTVLGYLSRLHLPALPTPEQPRLALEEASGMELVKAHDLRHPGLTQYLEKRCIPLDIARAWLREVHYRHDGRNFFALGFANDRGGMELRNAYFQGCLPPKSPTWRRQNSDRLTVFEGFFDFLSWLTLQRRTQPEGDVLVLNSLVYAPQAGADLLTYRHISLYLDNDAAGQAAVQHFPNAVNCAPEFSPHHDLNDFLCAQSSSEGRPATFDRAE